MTKDENIEVAVNIADRWSHPEKLTLIRTLLSMLDETTLNLVVRQLEADHPDESEG